MDINVKGYPHLKKRGGVVVVQHDEPKKRKDEEAEDFVNKVYALESDIAELKTGLNTILEILKNGNKQ